MTTTEERPEGWVYVDDLNGPRVVIDNTRCLTTPYWLPAGSGRCDRQANQARLASMAPSMHLCLTWAAGLAIGVRGGWPANEVQQVLSACARGEDWQALRDKLQTRRTR